MENNRPVRCIDPVVRYCQDCKYGFVKYPFESGCIYGLENTVPAPEEKEEFLESLKKK